MDLVLIIGAAVLLLWPKLRAVAPSVTILDSLSLVVHRGVCDLLLTLASALFGLWNDAESQAALAALRTKNDTWTYTPPTT